MLSEKFVFSLNDATFLETLQHCSIQFNLVCVSVTYIIMSWKPIIYKIYVTWSFCTPY